MKEYIAMWQNFFNFSGTTNRRGYWMAFLFNWIISFVIGLIANFTGLTVLATIYSYAALIPGISISVRRLRDAGKHWAWYFINFLPLIGQIWFIILLCKPSAQTAQPTYYSTNEYDY